MQVQHELLNELYAFTDKENETCERFRVLASDTIDALIAAGNNPYAVFKIQPYSAFNFLFQTYLHPLVCEEIVARWQDWASEYPALVARNPKLELYDRLSELSENDVCRSWPSDQEHWLWQWVESGDVSTYPLQDRNDMITQALFDRLCELRNKISGWLYYEDAQQKVVYAAEPDWRKVIAERDMKEREAWERFYPGKPFISIWDRVQQNRKRERRR